jgi:hypothetical protein
MRGFAVLAMICVHCTRTLFEKPAMKSPLGMFFNFIGGAPAAPVFMFLMGYVFSRKTLLESHLERALKLIFAGYALNFFRASLPIWLGSSHTGDPIEFLFMVDILQLAALSLAFLALIEHFQISEKVQWIGLLVVIFGSSSIWGWGEPKYSVLNLFWGRGANDYFIFFPWIAYPWAGFLMKNKSPRLYWIGGAALVAVGAVLHRWTMQQEGAADKFDYYASTEGSTLWMLGFCFLWFRVAERLAPKIEHTRVYAVLEFWSRSVTNMYIVSWLLICWGAFFIGYRSLSLVEGCLAIALCTLGSHLIVRALPDQLKI